MSEKKSIATRDGFGHEIVALGKENPDLLVVDIDIGKSCKTGDFRKELWPGIPEFPHADALRKMPDSNC